MGCLRATVGTQDISYLSNPAFLFHGHSICRLQLEFSHFLTSLPAMDSASFSLVTSLMWHNEPKSWLLWFYFISSWVTSSGVYGHFNLFSFESSLPFLPNLQFSCLAFLLFENVSQFVPRIFTLHNYPCTEMFNRVKLYLYCLWVLWFTLRK